MAGDETILDDLSDAEVDAILDTLYTRTEWPPLDGEGDDQC
jgi:hypothetical protein